MAGFFAEQMTTVELAGTSVCRIKAVFCIWINARGKRWARLAEEDNLKTWTFKKGLSHGTVTLLRSIWFPVIGNLNDLHPEYEVRDFNNRYRYLDLAYMHEAIDAGAWWLVVFADSLLVHSWRPRDVQAVGTIFRREICIDRCKVRFELGRKRNATVCTQMDARIRNSRASRSSGSVWESHKSYSSFSCGQELARCG